MKTNEILISYLKDIIQGYKIKAEYSTNDADLNVIVVQETDGPKTVLWNGKHMFDYFSINIFGKSIQEQKETANELNKLIGHTAIKEFETDGKVEKWKLIFKQVSNAQSIDYQDIRRIGYNLTLQTIITKFYEGVKK